MYLPPFLIAECKIRTNLTAKWSQATFRRVYWKNFKYYRWDQKQRRKWNTSVSHEAGKNSKLHRRKMKIYIPQATASFINLSYLREHTAFEANFF